MAKILCGTSGLTGITNASLELLNRLRKEGHEVLYVSPKDISEKVTHAGFTYLQLPQILSEPQLEMPAFTGLFRKVKRLIYKVRCRKELQQTALLNLRPQAFQRIFQEYEPDISILDVELHEYIMYARSQDTQLILLSQWFSLWERPGLPYLLHNIIPESGLSGTSLGIWISWRIVRLQRSWTFFKKRIRSGGTDRRSILLDYAAEVGFDKGCIRENNWPGPFLYNTIPVLSMTMAELEFPHVHQPNLHYVGAMVFEGRQDKTMSSADALKMNQVLELHRDKGKKIIYCSVSTLHPGDQMFMERVMYAVSRQEDWVLVLSMGGNVDLANFSNIPSNVYAMAFVPQLDILEQASCSINHGGIHTINECIHYQVPMLVYSGKRSDQNGCAARVAYHNLGVIGDKDLDTPNVIKSNIEEVLTNPRYAESMHLAHGNYLKYKSDRVLEEYIVNSLNN